MERAQLALDAFYKDIQAKFDAGDFDAVSDDNPVIAKYALICLKRWAQKEIDATDAGSFASKTARMKWVRSKVDIAPTLETRLDIYLKIQGMFVAKKIQDVEDCFLQIVKQAFQEWYDSLPADEVTIDEWKELLTAEQVMNEQTTKPRGRPKKKRTVNDN